MRRGIAAGAIISLLVNGAMFVWVATSSFSCGKPLPGSEMLFLPVLLSLLVGIAALPFFPFRQTRPSALVAAAACGTYVVSGIGAAWAGQAIRMIGFKRFTHRAAPLIQAIQDFERAYGEPPASLDQLVPKFLPSVPSTGVGSAPTFQYSAGEAASKYDGNPWVLKLDVGTGVLNWDLLLYFPLQNYPQVGYGGSLERVNDWAYVHE